VSKLNDEEWIRQIITIEIGCPAKVQSRGWYDQQIWTLYELLRAQQDELNSLRAQIADAQRGAETPIEAALRALQADELESTDLDLSQAVRCGECGLLWLDGRQVCPHFATAYERRNGLVVEPPSE
jgi:hypothetical protein